MGIKNLNTLIEKHAPDAQVQIGVSDFAHKRIAVDASGLMYTYMAIARKKIVNRTNVAVDEPDEYLITKEWVSMYLSFIFKLLAEKITPVIVFDGKPHQAKDETRAERRAQREKYKQESIAAKQRMKDDPLSNTSDDIAALRKTLINYNTISTEEFKVMKTIFTGIGIPCIQAKYDGEQLCSMLCREGIVAAVYSKDTDNIAYGCPLLITEISKDYSYNDAGERESNLSCVRYDKVIAGLQLEEPSFLDLCIMCGCDFNSNIPGIAAIKSYKLIQERGNIDNLPASLDTTILNHEECREIFAPVLSKDLIVTDESTGFNINKEAIIDARSHLETFDLGPFMERLVPLYNLFDFEPQEGFIQFPKKKILLKKTSTSGSSSSEAQSPLKMKLTESPDREEPKTPMIKEKKKIILVKKKVIEEPKILQFN